MSTLLELARAGQPMPFECIDMHGHLGCYEFAIPDVSVETLVRSMDRMGIGRYWTSHMRCMSADVEWGNREVLAAMRKFPGRVLGALSVWPSDAARVEREVRWGMAEGFSGFKLHNSNGFPYTRETYAPLYEVANERRMPILFHTWGEDAMFREIREISARYPDTSLLLAHTGSANKDGYVAIARECPNVYLELTFSRSLRGLVEELVAAVGADRVVWGSDAVFMSNTNQIGKVLGAQISDADKRKILSTNAAAILARCRVLNGGHSG